MTETTIVGLPAILDGFPPHPASAHPVGDWHEVPKGFYAIPIWDWMKFGDDCGSDSDAPGPDAELLGYRLFERKVPREFKTGKRAGQRVGRDELTIGHRVVAEGVTDYVLWAGTENEVRHTPWDRLKREVTSDRYVIEHDSRRDGDTEPSCRCHACLLEKGEYRLHWKAVPNQREAYINTIASMILDGIKSHEDIYRKLYGQLTGNCGICGRVLTDPTSKLIGIGPDCRGYR